MHLSLRRIALCALLLLNLYAKAQTISTIAGTGVDDYSGDGSSATSATLFGPTGICTDTTGNIYIADNANHVIRKINTSGTITTIAGNNKPGYFGDNESATSAELNFPYRLCIDGIGNIYFSDQQNSVIRRIDANGIITTIAGNGTKGFSGDGGLATEAQLNDPLGIAIDSIGDLYIAEGYNQRIRKINTSGVITTIAGNGDRGYAGDGNAAIQAELNAPTGIAVDNSGNIYFTEELNNDVRKIDTSGIITTVAGNQTKGYSGDGSLATNAQLNAPLGISIDANNNLYITDASNFVVRKITTDGIITTIAGTGNQSNSLTGNGQAIQINLGSPNGIAVDATGNVYVTDAGQNVIRKISNQ
ncbi:NHL repeat-containing protein [Ferruginibacter albus]|uniref:NHL repeat-containing protein n=1 Tax=Ferruginibacter albus TaxID=2875540 RepID=UPI001CC4BFF5|nr:NHL repeat-containing protein [Ferruginibacter albus]UAY53234.1 SMP-30/gluconolactonase/LRE family protein [Ferruginibacter albus]